MNYKQLKKIMAKRRLSVNKLAKLAGVSRLSCCLGLWGMREFTLSEINKLSKALNLSRTEMMQIFFEQKVS